MYPGIEIQCSRLNICSCGFRSQQHISVIGTGLYVIRTLRDVLDAHDVLLALLDENGNARPMPDTAGVTACYDADLNPAPQGDYRVDVTWLPEETETGTMIRSVIEVRCGENSEPVYRLETESFRPEVSA